jgi:hypothetical protein
VIIAVVAVWVMKVPFHEIVVMVAVRHGFMAAVRPMTVTILVPSGESGSAFGRVPVVHRKAVLVHVIPVRVMQAAIVKVVRMTLVQNGGMTAIGTVLVGMALVNLVRHLISFRLT